MNLILEHEQRLRRDPAWAPIMAAPDAKLRIREAAERSAIDQVLLTQFAGADPRPIDRSEIESEVERRKAQANCRNAFDDSAVRREAETLARVHRLVTETAARFPKPDHRVLRRIYRENSLELRRPETVHVAHIVKYVDELQDERQARIGIEAAQMELAAGVAFESVAARYSDCKDVGGDLGTFSRGVMVAEFDAVVFRMEPGETSGIFPTPFGFHIARLVQRNEAFLAPFESVRPQIEARLAADMRQQAVRQLIAEARSRSSIRRVSRGEAERMVQSA
jgi:parvulin-like peptidyl-prolyl isomerase